MGCHFLAVLLPVSLLWGVLKKRNREALEARLDALDPASDEYLAWDARSFYLRPSQTKSMVFSGKDGGIA